jgi:antitoxin (DNA-binding transcriptional repressor) of toxin-antitoxin stability system
MRRIAKGESFTVTVRGQKVALLSPCPKEKTKFSRGAAKDAGLKLVMAEDFDAPITEFEDDL